MLTSADADLLVKQHLGDTPRAKHSRFVAYVMRQLAPTFAANPDLWEIVGLCHDLDYFHTSGDWSQHGLVTIRWLGDSIPLEAQQAIAAHDHRTGVQSDSLLADMLKAADAIAIVDERLGRDSFRNADLAAPYPTLRNQLGDRSYLGDILERYLGTHELSFGHIVGIVAHAPRQ